MAKKPVSVLVSRSQKKKPTKHIGKRRKLKSAFNAIFNYMKSNSYMFAPFIHRQSSPVVSSGEVSFKPIDKKEKKLVEDVNGYLKCDAYMYAPLVTDSAYDADQCRGNVCDQMETRTEETAGDDEHTLISSRDVERDDSDRHNPMRRIVVEYGLLQTESAKHIVHQNCRSLSATGKVLPQKEPRKVVVE